MLDVHPPHGPTHTWKEFFIHLATIVIGLLIAVGIEHAVERIHAAYELREARDAIEIEMHGNVTNLAADERYWLKTFAKLKNNLLVLEFIRQHPGVPQSELPGDLRWEQYPFRADSVAWNATIKKGTIQLMPLDEANRNQLIYIILDGLQNQSLQTWDAINNARKFDTLDSDPTHLSSAELNETIRLTEFALARHLEMGYSFGWMAQAFPEMSHGITYDLIQKLRPDPIDLNPATLAAAHRRTDDRIDAMLTDSARAAGEHTGKSDQPSK